ncbi:MAG: protein TolR [Magnetococcales bacterium]|nr:protein TolR [Magnetococcales bacterium]
MSMGVNLDGGSGPENRYGAMSEINVTPLVDIMLVLLIIFMVAAPLMTQGIEVNLPKAQTNALASNMEPLVVSVSRDGNAFIEQNPVTIVELKDKIFRIRQTNPNLPVYVRGDNQAEYGAVMQVMAQLHQAGIDKIGLVTEAPN